MSSTQSFSKRINAADTGYLASTDGMATNNYISALGRNVLLYMDNASWKTAVFNSNLNNSIYPNATAKPIKGDIQCGVVVQYRLLGQKGEGKVCFGDASIYHWEHSSSAVKYDATKTSSGNTSSALTNSNRGTKLSIQLYSQHSGYSCSLEWISFTLYFTRYDFSASAGTGIASASVSSSTGYDGDTITFTASLQSGYEFDGWYNGSTKVSGSQSYTHTVNGADLSLTAKARQTVVTKSLSATYNGSQLQSFPLSVTAASSIVYNGVTTTVPFDGTAKTMLCGGKVMNGNAVIGGKALQCANKLMATDVVVFILNNMLNLNSFTLGNVSVSGGVYAFQPNALAMINQDLPTPIAGHKYYGRCYQKAPSGSTFADGRFEYYQTDGATTNMTFCTMSDTVRDNQWHLHSAIRSLSTIGASPGWKLRSFTVSGTAESYRKEMLIVDLTNMFGAGNEPTKEWCDANLY